MKKLNLYTLISLGAFITFLVLSNITATLFSQSFGIGLLDLNGAPNALSTTTSLALPADGTDRVQSIIDTYSPNASTVHAVMTLTQDTLLPLSALALGIFGSLNLARLFGGKKAIAAIGIMIASLYTLSDLTENVIELTLLVGNTNEALLTTLTVLHSLKSAFSALLVGSLALGYAWVGISKLIGTTNRTQAAVVSKAS